MHAKGEREIKITQGLDVIAVMFRYGMGLFICFVVLYILPELLLFNCVFKMIDRVNLFLFFNHLT